jgi:hypothetical protein
VRLYVPELIAACVALTAFAPFATMAHAAGRNVSVMSKEECRRKIVERRNRIGPGKGHFSAFEGEHDFGSVGMNGRRPPKFVAWCTERYGRL